MNEWERGEDMSELNNGMKEGMFGEWVNHKKKECGWIPTYPTSLA